MKPILTLAEARELKEKHPTPFYIYDEKWYEGKPAEYLAAFDGIRDFANTLR